jgi:hypothetical protein
MFLWTIRGSTFTFIVCGGYGGIESNVDYNNGLGSLDRFSVGSRDNDVLVVNHLLFAEDTLIFCGAQSKQFDICDVSSYDLR